MPAVIMDQISTNHNPTELEGGTGSFTLELPDDLPYENYSGGPDGNVFDFDVPIITGDVSDPGMEIPLEPIPVEPRRESLSDATSSEKETNPDQSRSESNRSGAVVPEPQLPLEPNPVDIGANLPELAPIPFGNAIEQEANNASRDHLAENPEFADSQLERLERLTDFAKQQRELVAKEIITDVEAMARVVDSAALLSTDFSGLIVNMDIDGFLDLLNHVLPGRLSWRDREITDPKHFVKFGQTGFKPEYQEWGSGFDRRNNQVRHFIGLFISAYKLQIYPLGRAAYNFQLFRTESWFRNAVPGNNELGTRTRQDWRLGQKSLELAVNLYLGKVNILEVGDWIRSNLKATK